MITCLQNKLINKGFIQKIPFISGSQWWWRENDLKDFYLNKTEEINIENVFKYNW